MSDATSSACSSTKLCGGTDRPAAAWAARSSSRAAARAVPGELRFARTEPLGPTRTPASSPLHGRRAPNSSADEPAPPATIDRLRRTARAARRRVAVSEDTSRVASLPASSSTCSSATPAARSSAATVLLTFEYPSTLFPRRKGIFACIVGFSMSARSLSRETVGQSADAAAPPSGGPSGHTLPASRFLMVGSSLMRSIEHDRQ